MACDGERVGSIAVPRPKVLNITFPKDSSDRTSHVAPVDFRFHDFSVKVEITIQDGRAFSRRNP